MHNSPQDSIEALLLKFEAGQCTAEESSRVEQFLEQEAQSTPDIYGAFVNTERNKTSSSEFEHILAQDEDMMDAFLDSQLADMGTNYQDYISASRTQTSKIDFDQIVESNPSMLDAFLEEQEQEVDPLYTALIEDTVKQRSKLELSKLIPLEQEATIRTMSGRSWYRPVSAVAAALLCVFAVVFLMRNPATEVEAYAELTPQEELEAKQALEYTLAALGMTKNKLSKGTKNLHVLKALEHTEIFKSIN